MRITRTRSKVLFVAAYLVVSTSGIVTGGYGLPPPVTEIIGFSTSALFVFLGIRTFRGRNEQVAPPRVWWRVAGGPKSSLIIGLFSGLLFIYFGVHALVTPPHGAVAIIGVVDSIVMFGALAYFYLQRAFRLRAIATRVETTELTTTSD